MTHSGPIQSTYKLLKMAKKKEASPFQQWFWTFVALGVPLAIWMGIQKYGSVDPSTGREIAGLAEVVRNGHSDSAGGLPVFQDKK